MIPVRATEGVFLLPRDIGEVEADYRRVAHVLREVAKGEDGFFRQHIDVVSISLGTWPRSESLCSAVEEATTSGTIVVVAAGNVVSRAVYPARCRTAIAVAGSTYGQWPWSGSAGGEVVEVAAPAHGVWTAAVVSGVPCIEASSGTSFATALVAGMAATWVGEKRRRGDLPSDPVEAFRQKLRTSARPWKGHRANEFARRYGAGIADLGRLMAE